VPASRCISGGQGLLDQVEGRDHTTVAAWLLARPKTWRDQVRFVAIDMSASYAAAVRLALPHATIVVDHFHVVQLANHAVTELRRRLAWAYRDRRGRKGDPEWDARRALLRNHEDLNPTQEAKLIDTLTRLGEHGVTLLGAWIIKEKLRDLLRLARTQPDPEQVRAGLYEFHDWCAMSGQPELHRLATTIERWWPAIRAFIATGITNAVSEGLNRVIKLEARKAYGFRNPANQRLRIRCATNRRTRGHLKPACSREGTRKYGAILILLTPRVEKIGYLNNKVKYSVMTVASAIDASPHSARCGSYAA
jgi:transposase